MSKTSLESRLDVALRLDEPPPAKYIAMLERLERVVTYLAKVINAGHETATVMLEPGHQLTAGQQFNIVLRIPKLHDYQETVFRAYLKADGSAATLDFIGDTPRTVRTPTALEDEVVRFLGQEPIRNLIRSLRDLAAGAARAARAEPGVEVTLTAAAARPSSGRSST